jgi:hypothetical protein
MAEFGVESIRIDDLRIPTDESGRLLINYLGPRRRFPTIQLETLFPDTLLLNCSKTKS